MSTAGKVALGVVSVSMAIVATQAMAAIGRDGGGVTEVAAVGAAHELQSKIDAAVAKRDVRSAVAEAFEALAGSFGKGDESLAAKYFGAEGRVAQASDFTLGGTACHSAAPVGGCYSNCHSACHSACHGSRGWR